MNKQKRLKIQTVLIVAGALLFSSSYWLAKLFPNSALPKFMTFLFSNLFYFLGIVCVGIIYLAIYRVAKKHDTLLGNSIRCVILISGVLVLGFIMFDFYQTLLGHSFLPKLKEFLFFAYVYLLTICSAGIIYLVIYRASKKRGTLLGNSIRYATLISCVPTLGFISYCFYEILSGKWGGDGFIFLPIIMYGPIIAVAAFVLGWAVAVILLAFQSKRTKPEIAQASVHVPKGYIIAAIIILASAATAVVTKATYLNHQTKIRSAVSEQQLRDFYILPWAEDDPQLLAEIARHQMCPPDILMKLSEHPSGIVRGAVAFNKKTSQDILTKLGRDKDFNVRFGVADNHNTPSEILRELSQYPEFQDSLASNPNTPSDALLILSKHAGFFVAATILNHPHVTDEVVLELTKSADENVSRIAREKLEQRARIGAETAPH